MADFTVSLGIVWTPPSAASNSGNSNLSSNGTDNAQSVGKIDVPNGTPSGTSFIVPFGAISAAKVCIIQNLMSTEIEVRLNGAGSATFDLGAGQFFPLSGPVAGSTTPLTAVEVLTTADPASTEIINFWLLGD